jgi:GT2 family glycosyltransferase
MKNSISFCIASAKNEKYYTLGVLKSLEKNTNFSEHEAVIFIDSDNQDTYEALLEYRKNKPNIKIHRNTTGFPIGSQRNVSIMFAHASKEIVIYLQSDMVVCPDFDKYFLEALDNNKNRVISAARIEPPLHPSSPEKIVKDFGLSPEEFKYQEFYQFARDLQKENRPLMDGHFAPFGCFKETYFNVIGGFDTQFRCSREDSDFIIRLKSLNLETYQSWNACVYHYTCVSSRGNDWYKQTTSAEIKNEWQSKADQEELKRFIRKWGYFGHDYRSKYQTTLVLDINTAPNLNLLSQIEPYFDKIVLNEKPVIDALISFVKYESYYFANKRWGYTQEHWDSIRHKFMGPNLEEKFIHINDYSFDDQIVIKTDLHSLHKNLKSEEVQQFMQNYNLMFHNLLTTSPESYKGKYQINCFEVEINELTDSNIIHLDTQQYLFDTNEFIFD